MMVMVAVARHDNDARPISVIVSTVIAVVMMVVVVVVMMMMMIVVLGKLDIFVR